MACAAPGCNSKFVKGGIITFHSFPKDEGRRKLWEKQLKRENFKATNYSKLCSKHFKPDCFDTGKFGGTWLKSDAVPTIFNCPPHFQKPRVGRKPLKSRCVANQFCSNERDEEFKRRWKENSRFVKHLKKSSEKKHYLQEELSFPLPFMRPIQDMKIMDIVSKYIDIKAENNDEEIDKLRTPCTSNQVSENFESSSSRVESPSSFVERPSIAAENPSSFVERPSITAESPSSFVESSSTYIKEEQIEICEEETSVSDERGEKRPFSVICDGSEFAASKKITKEQDMVESVTNVQSNLMEKNVEREVEKTEDEEFIHFFISFLPEIRQFSQRKKRKFKSKMLDLFNCIAEEDD